MVWLGAAAQGRDNNLNLIRMLAATAVLVSHAWPMTFGPGVLEPMERLAGHSLGRLSVYVFFAISGFLIAASFTRSSSQGRFVLARVLRLMPGLFVSLVLVGLVLGPLVTRLPVADYLSQPGPWTSILRNLTLVFPQYTLPGVFADNPYPSVQGSIWTLVHEVICYGLVFVAGLFGALRPGWPMLVLLGLYGAGWAMTGLTDLPVHPKIMLLQTLSLPYVAGMAAWVWRDRIPLSFWGIVVLALAWLAVRQTAVAYPALIGLLFYATFWLAYVPQGWLRGYNRLGDFSYGMYIYAFPIQGLVVWLFGPTTPAAHIALAFPLTLLLAILSWHLVEQPALGMMKRGRAAKPSPPQFVRASFGDTPWIKRP